MLALKNYQQECLSQLREYFAYVGSMGAATAFYHCTQRPYHPAPNLRELPYVCIRVPTGGGKTFMACHALDIAAKEYLQQERLVCLWLVPSNAIREQTLRALRDRDHSYRQAIDTAFAGNVDVMDLSEALFIQPNTLKGATCIIVSTLAALRVEDTEGRKIYDSAGALQPHFYGLPSFLEEKLEKNGDGTIPYSLANVMRLWEPVIIMDEAHNARTRLSFETLERFNPSCIIEFTATPQLENDPGRGKYASNLIAHTSAAQLKAEQMIKLPIKLHTSPDWKEILAYTVQVQQTLEKLCVKEQEMTGEYIRPIALLQSQPHHKERETITAEIVKEALLGDCKVPEEQVALATGTHREIEDVNLFDTDCPIRFIITQQALKEGWDCSFAYIFCSVADIGSARDVEQLLGRVFRLPNAKSKQHEKLNWAYAAVSSQRFMNTLKSLAEALVENGFERIEAHSFIAQETTDMPLSGTLLYTAYVSEHVPEVPDLSSLEERLQERVEFDPKNKTLTVYGALTEPEHSALEACFQTQEGKQVIQRINEELQQKTAVLSHIAEPVRVPALCIRIDGQLELFEESHFLDNLWSLTECDPVLTESDFPTTVEASTDGEVDVTETGMIEIRFIQQVRSQLSMMRVERGWLQPELVNWLDRNIPHPDITRTQATLFIYQVVGHLHESRGMTVDQLVHERYRLRDAIAALIDKHRNEMRKEGYQKSLFGPQAEEIETSPDVTLNIDQATYAPRWYYNGMYQFQKHAFPQVGELGSDGEEFECAQFIDQLSQVRRWVRNLERRPESSFWLQTSSDRFYPDFVAELADGRYLVVESKGEHLWSNEDSREKRAVGELWADRSNGQCIFVMPRGPQWSAIAEAITTT